MSSSAAPDSVANTIFQIPRLLPVIDIREGIVVQGVAGERQSYRPLSSPLSESPDPVDVATGLQDLAGHDWLYVADLDAIEHDVPDWGTLSRLERAGCQLVVDAGLREVSRARRLIDSGVSGIIAALETLSGPEVLAGIVDAVGGQQTLFSLDLKNGRVLGNPEGWGATDPYEISARAVGEGVQGLIVLDLAGIGGHGGVATAKLCHGIRQRHSHVRLLTGGGVRNADDMQALLGQGVDSVLVASALHNGAIDAAATASFR